MKHEQASLPGGNLLPVSCCSDVCVFMEGHLICDKTLKQITVVNFVEEDVVSTFFCRMMINEMNLWAG